MDEFTNPTNLNATSGLSTTTIATALKIMSISSTTDNGLASRMRCPHCKSQVILGSLNSIDLWDLNGIRHFCEEPARIDHEEKCITQIQKIMEYYNRHEFSSFQLALKMDD
jgi:hypothetical protein